MKIEFDVEQAEKRAENILSWIGLLLICLLFIGGIGFGVNMVTILCSIPFVSYTGSEMITTWSWWHILRPLCVFGVTSVLFFLSGIKFNKKSKDEPTTF